MSDEKRDLKTVSVIIPAFNAEKFIDSTIQSVLSQTYPPIEIIVVDDGSSDNTHALVRSFGDKVLLLEQIHKGVAAARNTGIMKARGEYIAFLDADDLWLPEKLERQMGALAEEDYQWIYCDSIWFSDTSGKKRFHLYPKRYNGDILEKLFLGCFIASPTPIIHRSIFEKVGLFHEETVFGEDWDMWIRIAANYPIKYIKEDLAMIRLHTSSIIKSMPVEIKLANSLATVESAIQREPKRLMPLRDYKLNRLYHHFSKSCVLNREISTARGYLRNALKYYPYSFDTILLSLFLGMNETLVYRIISLYQNFKRSIGR